MTATVDPAIIDIRPCIFGASGLSIEMQIIRR